MNFTLQYFIEINLSVKKQNVLYSFSNRVCTAYPLKVCSSGYVTLWNICLNGMTFKFHNTCPLCLTTFRVTNDFYLSENNGYPKVTATCKKRPFLLAKLETNGGRYFRNSTVILESAD